ncbi:MAG: sigma-70 family RNA polymerase sigma factor [Planctomycetales bacterium]|nr:sigma-70 family RNA polymerase sigma factor [Planctomycetales bacterium]
MSELHSELLVHADDIWRIAIRLVSDEDDARECYQQTFADALRLSATAIDNWGCVLRQIATRRAIDILRRRYRDRAVADVTVAEAIVEDAPDATLRYAELRESVRVILARLPPRQAEAFYLRHVEQLDPAEIAASMQIQVNHVRVLVHRALAEIRSSLPECFQPAEINSKSAGDSDE